MGVDDVLDLHVTSGLGIIASVDGVKVSLGVVTVASLVLAKVGVVVVILYAPVKVVVGGMLRLNKQKAFNYKNTLLIASVY